MQVRETTKGPAFASKNVTIDSDQCKAIASIIQEEADSYSLSSWSAHELHPKEKGKATVDFIFVLDCLNFSLWSSLPDGERWAIEYRGQKWTGYWGLVAALQRGIEAGIPLTSLCWLRSPEFTFDKMSEIFRSSTKEPMPMLKERYEGLRAAALSLSAYDTFAQVVEQCGHSAVTLVKWVTSHIPTFNDTVDGIVFYKRAQILVGDLWACFEGKGWGQFDDIDQITMFADYRVPQVLADLGCLTYSPQLIAKLQTGYMFSYGDEDEVELRACSIWAVETILQYLAPGKFNAILLDFYLWDLAKRQESIAKTPIHLCRSIYY